MDCGNPARLSDSANLFKIRAHRCPNSSRNSVFVPAEFSACPELNNKEQLTSCYLTRTH